MTFDIISFTAARLQYFPASMNRQDWMPDSYVAHTDVTIPLGKSRYGGPVVDLPKGVEHPENLLFAAQLDLAEFSPFDRSGLLPESGQLIFFADIRNETGKVIYANVPNESLVREVWENEDDFFIGVLIDRVYADVEKWEDRYSDPEDEWGETHKNSEGKLWDDFAGSERSKIFGIHTHCQKSEEEIGAIASSDKILLLQIGENGFNDEGVFSVLIPKGDLQSLNFEHCEFTWGQS